MPLLGFGGREDRQPGCAGRVVAQLCGSGEAEEARAASRLPTLLTQLKAVELERDRLKEENAKLRRRVATLEDFATASQSPAASQTMWRVNSVANTEPSPSNPSLAEGLVDSFWGQLMGELQFDRSQASHELARPSSAVLRELMREVQLGQATCFIENGQIQRKVEVVRVYFLAVVDGEQRCLLERCLPPASSMPSGPRSMSGKKYGFRPLTSTIKIGETWQEAMARALEQQVSLDDRWQKKHLDVEEESYFVYQDDGDLPEGSPLYEVRTSQTVHEIYVKLKPLERVTARPSIVAKRMSEDDFRNKAVESIGLPAGQDFVVSEGTRIRVWCWKPRQFEKTGRFKSFSQYLVEHGIDVESFETAASGKTLLKLFIEVEELKDSFLQEFPREEGEDDPAEPRSPCVTWSDKAEATTISPKRVTKKPTKLRRVVELLRIRLLANIQNRNRILTASEQMMTDGGFRQRKFNELVVQKVRQGEDWRTAAERAFSSKLGIDEDIQAECFVIDENRTEYMEEIKETEHYGGLETLFKIRTVTMHVEDPKHPDLSWIGLPAGNDFVMKEGQLGARRGGRLHVWTWLPCDDEAGVDHIFVGTAFEELSHGMADAEQLIQQTKAHPQIATLGLNSPLSQALQKIRECMRKVADIDTTLGDVNVHAMVHGKDAEANGAGDEGDNAGQAALADFISAQFTRRGAAVPAIDNDAVGAMTNQFTEDPHDLQPDNSVVLNMRQGLDKWGYDLFELHEKTRKKVLQTYGGFVLSPLCKHAMGCSRDVTGAFLDRVAQSYLKNHYHNAIHAVQVCHSAIWLTRVLGLHPIQTPLERASFAIAALCHDVEHFGRNNDFCVKTEHWLALRYNNAHVMENYHAAKCWELMQLQFGSGANMVQMISKSDRQVARKQIIEYILATDMSEHFEVVSKLRVKVDSPDFSMSKVEEDAKFLSRMCIKAGDIGHSALPWNLHERWSVCCTKEFYEQGDEERLQGFQVTPLFDRGTVTDIGKSQKGFIEFVCLPLFEALSDAEVAASTSEPPSPLTPESAPLWRRKPSWGSHKQDGSDQRLERSCLNEMKANAKRWVEDNETVQGVVQQLSKGDSPRSASSSPRVSRVLSSQSPRVSRSGAITSPTTSPVFRSPGAPAV